MASALRRLRGHWQARPWHPKTWRIGLGARYLIAARSRGSQLLDVHEQHWPQADPQLALQALETWLEDKSGQPLTMDVTLSAQFAPVSVLPWREEMSLPAEQRLLAQHHYRRIYGDAATDWPCLVHASAIGQPWLSSTMDAHLLQQLHAIAAHHQARLRSVQPLSSALYRHLRSRLPADGWLAIPEPGQCSLLHWADAHWQLWTCLPATEQASLTMLVAREQRLAGLTERELPIYSLPGIDARHDECNKQEGVHLLQAGWSHTGTVQRSLHLLGSPS